jgi:hypothetical protein
MLNVGRGCCAVRVGIARAFDNIDHATCIRGLEALGVHPHLLASLLAELSNQSVTLNAGRVSVDDCVLGRGGRQGGRDTPTLWNLCLGIVLQDLVTNWEDRGTRWEKGDDCDCTRPLLNFLSGPTTCLFLLPVCVSPSLRVDPLVSLTARLRPTWAHWFSRKSSRAVAESHWRSDCFADWPQSGEQRCGALANGLIEDFEAYALFKWKPTVSWRIGKTR